MHGFDVVIEAVDRHPVVEAAVEAGTKMEHAAGADFKHSVAKRPESRRTAVSVSGLRTECE